MIDIDVDYVFNYDNKTVDSRASQYYRALIAITLIVERTVLILEKICVKIAYRSLLFTFVCAAEYRQRWDEIS